MKQPYSDDQEQLPKIEAGWAYRERGGIKKAIALKALPPREQAAQWHRSAYDNTKSPAKLAEALNGIGAGSMPKWVISISHDRYHAVVGGSQNCMSAEEATLSGTGWAYIHICPIQPMSSLAELAGWEQLIVEVSVNRRPLGICAMTELIAQASVLSAQGHPPTVVIHQMLGHAPESLTALIRACGSPKIFFWVHDLFAVCPSVHLLRNNVTFCGGPPIRSGACNICNAGDERAEHVERIVHFLNAIKPTLIAPSATILKFWQEKMGETDLTAIVLPPCHVEFDAKAIAFTHDRPLRIGFLGMPAFPKGWHVFEALARWHQDDERYKFFQLGMANPRVDCITHVKVGVTRENMNAMVDAISENCIDVIVNWSLCYESFSFTTMEAISAGAFIVAREGAGHIWPLISSVSANRGRALGTEEELQAIFADGTILDLVANADRRSGRLAFSGGTSDILLNEGCNA